MRRTVKTVSIDVTSRCNLCCAHCYNASGGSGACDMSDGVLLRVAKEVVRLSPESVCLCGGEPMLRSNLTDIMDALRDGTTSVSMVSNGLLIDDGAAARLKAHGLKAIQISLDGAYAWQHDSLRGTAGAFAAAKRAIRALQKAGIDQVFASMIPNKLNFRSVDAYCSLCYALGVKTVKCMPFMPMGRGKAVGKPLILSAEDMLRFQLRLSELKERYAGLMEIEWDDPVLTSRYLCERLEQGKTPLLLSISANGDVCTDVYAPVKLGNVTRDSLDTLLNEGIENAGKQGRFAEILNRLHEINDLGN